MNKTVNVNNIFTTFSFTNSNFLILLFSGEWWGANENCTLIDTVKNVTIDVNGTDVETTVSVFATGRFIQEPIISINLNFPAKKICTFCHLVRKSDDERTCGLRVFLQIICFKSYVNKKTHPEKNWREF